MTGGTVDNFNLRFSGEQSDSVIQAKQSGNSVWGVLKYEPFE